MSQSSSTPLQISTGGMQAPVVQVGLHVLVPVEPQVVVQPVTAPRTHAKPSSAMVSQSSSTPLQVSEGGVHVPLLQSD
jgi:hypothetical protein